MKNSLALSSNEFVNEEVVSQNAYPAKYRGPEPIENQIKTIANIFNLFSPQAIKFANNLPELPEDAEGWFAIPTAEALARNYFSKVTDPAEKYCRAVNLILEKIAASRLFHNYREGQIVPQTLRIHVRTAEFIERLIETQPGDILIIAAQLGMRHRGRSVRRAREVFTANEFGLWSLVIGSIALTHPERFTRIEELDIDCAGEEFSVDADDQFDDAPLFCFGVGRLGFNTSFAGNASPDYGTASAFLPQA
jgi:hypothetical protein